MRQVYLEGKKFGKLTVLTLIEGGSHTRYECRCDCGRITSRYSQNLQRPRKDSGPDCGNCSGNRGARNRPLGNTWRRMIARCTNKNDHNYKNYGAKGVKVCERWLKSFDDFARDVGPKPGRGFTLDRFPNKRGNYEPGNVRWATAEEQQNNKTDNILIRHEGREQTLAQWAKEFHIPFMRLYDARRRGLTLLESIEYYNATCTLERLTVLAKKRRKQ